MLAMSVLTKIAEHLYWMPPGAPDRPSVCGVVGDRRTVMLDAGSSSAHTRGFLDDGTKLRGSKIAFGVKPEQKPVQKRRSVASGGGGNGLLERRGWDSNPRDACAPSGFQDRCATRSRSTPPTKELPLGAWEGGVSPPPSVSRRLSGEGEHRNWRDELSLSQALCARNHDLSGAPPCSFSNVVMHW